MKDIRLKRYFYAILLCIITMTLSACGDDEGLTDEDYAFLSRQIDDDVPLINKKKLAEQVEANYDPSTIPVGMQNGVISKEYYLMLMEMIDKIGEYNYAYIDIKDNDSLPIEEKNYELIQLSEGLLIYLDSLAYLPQNDVEIEIHNRTQNVIARLENATNHRIKYCSGNEFYRELMYAEAATVADDLEAWALILDKHELFLEE